ncbi:MAG: DivIVA domain-containing protein [Thermoleophilia bacterium]|nr:DivIVA domain-containing protein [Thermoleophilia bacterium]
MTMSPFEVERREFGRSAMGYKKTEVDGFLDEVRGSLMGLWQERTDLREENERLNERVARYTALEEQLKNTLILAQDSAEKAQEQARRESELLMREAGQKAREIVHNAHEQRQRLEGALRELHSAEQETRQRFRALAQTVISHLDDTDASSADSATTLRAVVQGSPRQTERREASRAQAPAPVRREAPRARVIETPPSFDPSSFASRSSDAPVPTGELSPAGSAPDK